MGWILFGVFFLSVMVPVWVVAQVEIERKLAEWPPIAILWFSALMIAVVGVGALFCGLNELCPDPPPAAETEEPK